MDAAFAEWVRTGWAFHSPFQYHGHILFDIQQVLNMAKVITTIMTLQVMLFCKDLETKKCFAIAFVQSLETPREDPMQSLKCG